MTFNSTIFVIFFIVVYSLYLLLRKNYKYQNYLLLAASYVFYGYWDWRFLFLLMVSTGVDFFIGKKIDGTEDWKKKKILLSISIVTSLVILGFFKYFNFFAESVVDLFNTAGFKADDITLKIILPVGISFYIFQTMSYTIDVYRGKLSACKNLVDFSLFVSFFPQLVAGPIERASNLLPQIERARKIELDQVYAGIYLVLWGFFKKVVVADNVAVVANQIFNNHTDYQGADLIIGVVAFALQIYGDFSGYSDIARGLAKLMGFDLMINFKLPYFAVSPSDFWNRWHISLSSWLKDYLYIPLGGNRKGNFNTYRNLFLTMSLGGLWHGASWNFLFWGVYHGLLLIIYRIIGIRFQMNYSSKKTYRYSKVIIQWVLMISFTLGGWLLFRAESTEQIIYFIKNSGLATSSMTMAYLFNLAFFSSILIIIQVFQHWKNDLLVIIRLPVFFLAVFYGFLFSAIIIFGVRESSEFIYFQF